jgi:two-component system nitrogen regulation sensor histidine kinase NtrY
MDSPVMIRVRRMVVPILWVLTIFSAVLTYQQITNSNQIIENAMRVWGLLVVNFVLMLALGGMYARRIFFALTRMKTQVGTSSTSALKKRMMIAFGVVTMVPTLSVSLFAFFFFNLGIQTWFNDRVKTALSESLAVAEAYFDEHRENIRADALAMANDLNNIAGAAQSNPPEFNRIVNTQAELRLLTEAIVFRQNRIIAQGRLSFALAFESVPQDALERAANGEAVIFTNDEQDKVRALVKIESIPQGYLLVGRLIDGKVLSHMEKTQGAYKEYMELRKSIGQIQFTVSLVFLALALLLLLGALWYALVFAGRVTEPVSALALAAERIRSGDFGVRVITQESGDEIATLSRAFNRMAEQLEAQRADLITANRNLDERRRFSEAVLAGVSAGVVALNEELEINLVNRSAEALLLSDVGSETLIGKALAEVVPDVKSLLAELVATPTKQVQGAVTYERGGQFLTLHARLTAEMMGETVLGYIATFDDITPLIAAQRQAAWSDVARRIAHEIKNPLTPIALSAERLKRKYLKMVGDEEAENFTKYTDTIEHHVGNIGRMVEEFVQFARIPNPVFANVDVRTIIRKVVFSEKVAHANVEYALQLGEVPLMIACDERLLSQLFINLLKNAAEAMEQENAANVSPKIEIEAMLEQGNVMVRIRDNGAGFPDAKVENLFEPYVTTRAKGTGLGLAISKKIVEDHKGSIKLSNHPDGGALVSVTFLQV